VDIITSVRELRERLRREPDNVFVPTMGNLHAGHIQLMRLAKRRAACTVVSIFVNRLQFGPKEDFDRYPRTLQADAEKMREIGVDVVFAPGESEIYPERQTFTVDPSAELQHILEGAFRPGHFRGVATVVLKLFNMVAPRAAIFGKKDYQQYVVLRDMVKELALPVEIIPAETVRAEDGLALSSRNAFLSAAERAEAPRLYRILREVRDELLADRRDLAGLEKQALGKFGKSWIPDYVAVRRQSDLQPPASGDRELVILGAAKLGAVRLIDNVELSL